jgi:signal transduction histidine kinase
MHDVLSHRLSVLLLQAGALAGTVQDPGVRRAIEELRANGAVALGELWDVFGVLAPAVETGSKQATDDSSLGLELAELVRQWQSTGTSLSFTEIDLPERLSPTIGRTAFRVVQEGLTNAAKYAAGSPVDVRVTGTESGISISVVNTAAATTVDDLVRQSGGGRGLAGLEERTRIVGGSMTSAPREEGGFEVHAWLPTRPQSTAGPAENGGR